MIIDDERRSRETLSTLLQEYTTDITIVDMADDVDTGVQAIETHQPDLVFLDVKMKTGTGFDLLKQIQNPAFQLIFTTAYHDFAIKAFRFNAIDYLLKPIGIDELIAAIGKVKNIKKNTDERERLQHLLDHWKRVNYDDPSITISTDATYEFLKVKEISRVEANGAYSLFVMNDGKKILSSKLLKEYESLLSEYNFIRIHHSYLVNMLSVSRYVKTDGGYVVMKDSTQIPVSRRKKDSFLKAFLDRD